MNLGPAVTVYGRKLLLTAVRAAEKRPRQFDIDEIIAVKDPEAVPKKGQKPGYCGTVGCIAGHMVLALATDIPDAYGNVPVPKEFCDYRGVRDGKVVDALSFAEAILGCSSEEADRLFLHSHPEPLDGKRVTAHNLRKRVQSWLRTGR